MNSVVLDRLTGDEFHKSIGPILPPRALRQVLLQSEHVQQVIYALAQGEITDDSIRDFVSALTANFVQGQKFPDDLALAALAVVLERRPTDFADEYLRGLAKLRLTEMVISANVARECLEQRKLLANNQQVTASVEGPPATHGVGP